MIVRRLQIAEHQLLQAALAFLEDVTVPIVDVETRGDWRADVDGGPPANNRPQPLAHRRLRIPSPVRLPEMNGDAMISALNYYPAGGAGIGWHTDSGHPGWRVYVALPLSPIAGVFRTVDGDYTDEEGEALAFYVAAAPPLSWHAVRATGPRLSLGIRFTDGPTQRLLGLAR